MKNPRKAKWFLMGLFIFKDVMGGSSFGSTVDCDRMANPAACRANQARLQKQRDDRRMRNTPHEAQQPIERTIEGFTLGMSLSDATRLLTHGIQKGQFKILRLSAGPNMERGELPITSNSNLYIGPATFRIKQSTLFSTAATYAVQLFFYEAKLYRIAMHPYASNMREALAAKYGPPFNYRSFWCSHTISEAWWDNQTTIMFCLGGTATTSYYAVGHQNRIDLKVNYVDRQLTDPMDNYTGPRQQQQEEQERRKRETLPQTY